MRTASRISFIILSLILILISPSVNGEKKETTLNLLRGGTWKAIIEKNDNVAELGKNFAKQNVTEYIVFFKTGKSEWQTDYYLSETPDTTFKVEKIGKSRNGKYIISQSSSGEGPIYVDEILELSPTYLKIKRLNGAITEWKRKDDKKNDQTTSKKP